VRRLDRKENTGETPMILSVLRREGALGESNPQFQFAVSFTPLR
jgi:hypothetical protein